jgi:hypothetical protein
MAEASKRSEVRQLIEEYCSRKRHPDLPNFVVSSHTVTDWRNAGAITKPGCYVIYRGAASPRVGKAERRVGDRLATHLSAATQEHNCWRTAGPESIDIIEVTEPWEAVALEAFLEERLGLKG